MSQNSLGYRYFSIAPAATIYGRMDMLGLKKIVDGLIKASAMR